MKRASFFVDGFNFYHAVADGHRPHLKWMSYRKLAERLIPRDEELAEVIIFSALATHIPKSMMRHRVVLEAWKADGCRCVMGQFKQKTVHCKTCKQRTLHHEEKESDVNIAIHLLNEARKGSFDVAYIVGNDSDLAPAFRMCREVYPHLELVTVAPPNRRSSKSLMAAGATRTIQVDWRHVETSLLPREVLRADGTVAATRPAIYDPPA